MESKLDKFYEFEGLYEGWIDMGERYEELKDKIVGQLTELEETLTEEQKNKLQTINLLCLQREYEAGKATYKAGFKTGLALAIEAVADEYKVEPIEEV